MNTTTTPAARLTLKSLQAEVNEEIASVRESLHNLAEGQRQQAEVLGMMLDVLRGGVVQSAPAPVAITVPTVQGTVVESVTAPVATPVAVAAKAEHTGLPFRELREILKAHKAAGHIKAGLTVKEAIAAGLMDEYGNLGNGVPVQVVVAEVPAQAPAKPRTEAQIEAAKRVAALEHRRADGTIAPKAEWEVREALHAQGFHDKAENDALIAKHGATALLEAISTL